MKHMHCKFQRPRYKNEMNTENVSKANHEQNKYSTIIKYKTKISQEIFIIHKIERNKQLNTFD